MSSKYVYPLLKYNRNFIHMPYMKTKTSIRSTASKFPKQKICLANPLNTKKIILAIDAYTK